MPGLHLDSLPALGIQKNTQALQHMLKHPVLYGSSKPRRDALQRHYAPKEKRVSPRLTECTGSPQDLTGAEAAVTSWPSKGHALPEPPTASLPVAVAVRGGEARRD